MAMSKTAAIREARSRVSHPHRYGPTDYVIFGPYRVADPYGPTTTAQRNSYPAAMRVRTRWIAEVALSLMGKYDAEEAFYAFDETHLDYHFGGYTVETLVNTGLKAYRGE